MTKPAPISILAATSALPVIVGCALLGATGARAATCTVNASSCQPYVVTIDQIGPNVVATGSGEFDTNSLTLATSGGGIIEAMIAPSTTASAR